MCTQAVSLSASRVGRQVGRQVSGSPGVHTGSITVGQSVRTKDIGLSEYAYRQHPVSPSVIHPVSTTDIGQSEYAHRQYHCQPVSQSDRTTDIGQFEYTHRQHPFQSLKHYNRPRAVRLCMQTAPCQSVTLFGRQTSGSSSMHTSSTPVSQSGRKTDIGQSEYAHKQYHCQSASMLGFSVRQDHSSTPVQSGHGGETF